jgi:ketopantoate reductase
MMNKSVVVMGMGEMGSVFARGFLRLGYTVVPVTSSMSPSKVAQTCSDPELVLVAVGEAALQPVLQTIPEVWRDRIALLQNELLPADWQQHNFTDPTVISVWFEKKKGMDSKPLISSPAWGPKASLLVDALAALDIPAHAVDSLDEMTYELVRKNVYIITTNIAGLEVGGTVSELWDGHEALAREVASDVMDVQELLVGAELPRERLIQGMLEAFDGDPDHNCMGRSAPARLARTLKEADLAGLKVAMLRKIAVQSRSK